MTTQATVIRSTGSTYTVQTQDGQTLECRLKGKMRLANSRTTNPVAVGDQVIIASDNNDYLITQVCPRRNYIIRRSTNLSKESHIIAANIDQALLLTTINHPETSTTFIDRFLASAEAFDIPTIIAFNKVDLYSQPELDELTYRQTLYNSLGYQTILLSSATLQGYDQLKSLLTNKLTAITGHSGVGKSTLINTLQPSLNIRTNTISQANNTGRHTTTFAEMHHLDFNADIIDTPGIRGFGIIDINPNETALYFRDIFALSHNCRYPNCTHTHEPGCAVLQALANSQLAPTRYQSYLNILQQDSNKYRDPQH